MNPNWARVAQALGAHGVDVAPDALAAADTWAKWRLDTPEWMRGTDDARRWEIFFDLVLRRAGIEPGPATHAAIEDLGRYHAAYNLWETVPDGVPAALARLRGLGRCMVVVSNANGTVHAHFTRLGLASFFDVIVDSAVEGLEKPDPRLFARALEKCGGRAETTVHVGDLYQVDVLGARAAGLQAWLFDVAGLYADADCPRVRTLDEVAERLG